MKIIIFAFLSISIITNILLLSSPASEPCLLNNISLIGLSSQAKPPSLIAAQEDVDLIMQGKEPKNAVFSAAASDGGSKLYKGKNYQITRNKSLVTVDGIHGYTMGVTVEMTEPTMSNAIFSHTWFSSSE